MSRKVAYWLMKCEPSVFSIHDLARSPGKTTHWDGVRNYQARNFMRDVMQKGDLAFFYHSNADPSGIAGLMHISRTGYPDPSQFDRRSKYFDETSDRASPRWTCVDVTLDHVFKDILPLERLRPVKALAGMPLLQKGSRLSVQPVSEAHWKHIVEMAKNLGLM